MNDILLGWLLLVGSIGFILLFLIVLCCIFGGNNENK